ncbi:hypothetical protein ILYODFUR_007742 [Ilyodon furcidens]|uniref:Uncharacterized protein n=1 Tax=Ilyodon furcidens TaxID=33524 RepID=A0ABV0VCN1_9TELE
MRNTWYKCPGKLEHCSVLLVKLQEFFLGKTFKKPSKPSKFFDAPNNNESREKNHVMQCLILQSHLQFFKSLFDMSGTGKHPGSLWPFSCDIESLKRICCLKLGTMPVWKVFGNL